MKINYILFFLVLISAAGFAQNVNFPDPVLKSYLVDNFDANGDGEIQVSEAQNITDVFISYLDVVDLTGLEQTHLQSLTLFGTGLTALNLTNFPFLQSVGCQNNESLYSVVALSNLTLTSVVISQQHPMASLDFSGCAALQIAMTDAAIQSINFSGCAALEVFEYHGPYLTQLNLEGCLSLDSFVCTECGLESFDFSGFPNLTVVDVQNSNFSSLHFGSKTIAYLDCRNNHLTELDFSSMQFGTNTVHAQNNEIRYLNFKNGYAEAFNNCNFQGNPITYICQDEDIEFAQYQLATQITTPFVVNSYCDFVPGGSFNTVSGNVRFDGDNNGCDASDNLLPLQMIRITGVADGYVTTDALGHYSTYLYSGNFTLAPSLENPDYFNISPAAAVSFTSSGGTQLTHDFCISPNGTHRDLEMTVSPVTALVPGFDATYRISYRNKGNQVLSGDLAFGYDEARLDFVWSEIIPVTVNPGALTWNFSGLAPFETRSVTVTLNANSPMETPTVNINDAFDFTAEGFVSSEAYPSDNQFVFHQKAVGSFDPNDKTCLEGETVSVSKIGDYLHYLIRFENTGNANAHNVVVKDMIDADKFDLSSLQLIGSSHDVMLRMSENRAEFILQGIELAAQVTGYVLFKIKTLPTLAENTTVSNQADIFFDYNFPIATNNAETTFQSLSVNDNENIEVSAYPIPTKDTLNLRCKTTVLSTEIYDVQGRLLFAKIANTNEFSIDFSDRGSGTYFVKVFSQKGTKTLKFVKD